jgi:aspartyl-tRNA(Asn)/glutamyl-tRNA(Gln) amidotransferase subunit C
VVEEQRELHLCRAREGSRVARSRVFRYRAPVMTDRPSVDRARVAHVASLASLSLSEDEIGKMVVELGRIVAYVEQLGALDTEGVVPTTSLSSGRDALRPDRVLPGLSHDEALAGAPRALSGGFAVPLFLEGARPER